MFYIYYVISDCQTHWVRLRQRFSKERQLRENETRSGAGKPIRRKWVLFENLSFLENIVTQKRFVLHPMRMIIDFYLNIFYKLHLYTYL